MFSGAVFEVALAGYGQRKKRGNRGALPPHKVHGGQPSALLALPKVGNCHDPHSDTVRNGSGPGKFGTYDPQLDPKA